MIVGWVLGGGFSRCALGAGWRVRAAGAGGGAFSKCGRRVRAASGKKRRGQLCFEVEGPAQRQGFVLMK